MSIEAVIKKKLDSFTLDVELRGGNEVLALLGASGCGKSMTLRCIAGIVTPDEGRIVVDGEVLFDSQQKIDLPPQKRRVGLLFQNYALFPTMTVEKNIAAGLREKGDERAKVAEYIRRFRLEGLEDRLPGQLSGGQQQRVALARMLISAPRLIMLDEPFSALDSYLRWELEREVMGVISQFSGTTLLVSHNRDEVYRICDRIAVYDAGPIDVLDEKWALFRDPRTYAGALLTGCKNLTPAEQEGEGLYRARNWGRTLRAPVQEGRTVRHLGIRAHQLQCVTEPGENVFAYEVVQTIEDTFSFILMIVPKGIDGAQPLRWELSKQDYRQLPDSGLVYLPPEEILLLE